MTPPHFTQRVTDDLTNVHSVDGRLLGCARRSGGLWFPESWGDTGVETVPECQLGSPHHGCAWEDEAVDAVLGHRFPKES